VENAVGNPEHCNETAPRNPPLGVIVTVVMAATPYSAVLENVSVAGDT
jgi:hypothetical protein